MNLRRPVPATSTGPRPWGIIAAISMLAACTASIGQGTSPSPPEPTAEAATPFALTDPSAEGWAIGGSPTLPPSSAVPPTDGEFAEPPAIDHGLAGYVPNAEGYSATAAPPATWTWQFFAIPDGFRVHPARITTADGAEIGRLMVVAADDGTSPIDSYIPTVFSEGANFLASGDYDDATVDTLVAVNYTAAPSRPSHSASV